MTGTKYVLEANLRLYSVAILGVEFKGEAIMVAVMKQLGKM